MTGTHIRQGHAAAAPGSTRMPGAARRRAFFFLLPNLVDDSELDVYAFRLLAHYQRVAGCEGTCAEPTATTAAWCGMSPRRVVQARTELMEAGWITVAYAGPVGQQVPVVSVVDRMADNIARYDRAPIVAAVPAAAAKPHALLPAEPTEPPAPAAAVPRTLDRPRLHVVQAPPEPAGRTPDKTPEDSGTPPLTPQPTPQQQGGASELTGTTCPCPPPHDSSVEEPARALVTAFYRGLGTTPSTATSTMQRRDLAIAQQLVKAGATPCEAEAYAREMSGLDGRLAPVDLRSFERERPGWLVRHRRQERRHQDRTGLPPSWLAGPPEPASTPAAHQHSRAPTGGRSGGTVGNATTARDRPELARERLGSALRAALLSGGR